MQLIFDITGVICNAILLIALGINHCCYKKTVVKKQFLTNRDLLVLHVTHSK